MTLQQQIALSVQENYTFFQKTVSTTELCHCSRSYKIKSVSICVSNCSDKILLKRQKSRKNSPVHMKQFSLLFQVSSIFRWQPIWNLWENTFRQSGVAKTHGDHCSQVSSSSVNFNEVSAVADPGFSIFPIWVVKRRQFFKCTIRVYLDIRFAVKQVHHCVQVWMNSFYQNFLDSPRVYD